MSDTIQSTGTAPAQHRLDARSEPFEVTPSLVATTLSFDGNEVPGEMMSAVERIWQDRDFTWPTTLSVTAISVTVEGAGDDARSVSRVSVVGTGFDPERPVRIAWRNAPGFPGGTAELVEVRTDAHGFFGAEIRATTAPRRAAEFTWDAASQLALVASQAGGPDGGRSAEQHPLPPHALWHWVR